MLRERNKTGDASERAATLPSLLRQHTRQEKIGRWAKPLWGVTVGAVLLVSWTGIGGAYQWLLFVACLLPFASLGIFWLVASQRWFAAVHQLAASLDLSAIGALIEAYSTLATWNTSEAQKLLIEVRAALTHLLPRLREEDAHRISQNQRALLHRLLNYEFQRRDQAAEAIEAEDRLHIAVLEGLSRVGDKTDLAAVRSILAGKGAADRPLLAAEIMQIYEKVREDTEIHRIRHKTIVQCAEAIEARLEREHLSQTHLRASKAPDADESQLLRGAQPQRATESPQQLLRAANDDEGVCNSDL